MSESAESADAVESEPRSAEQMTIDEGEAAHAYLTSEGGSKLVHRRNASLYEKWMLSTSVDERETIFCEMKSFNDFVAEVEATAKRGRLASDMRKRRAEVAERHEKMYGPKK
jgi:hypothetical protein